MLRVELSCRCNNACLFCSQALERADGPSEADEPLVRQVLRSATGVPVGIVGGEPTLDRRLSLFSSLARDQGASAVVVQTNGRRFAYVEYARELVRAGVCALDVSLQGSTAAMHDYHTAVPGSFSQTARGIANAAHAGLRVVITTIVTRSNVRHLSDVAQIAHSLGARALRLRRVRAVGNAVQLQQRLLPAAVLVAPYLQQAHRMQHQLRMPIFLETVRDPGAEFVDFVGGPPEQPPTSEDQNRWARDALAGLRTRPAHAENRGRDRLSGDALRQILPGLFEPDAKGP
jgi:molybdenum cofactor biosynthesis enzyme MoaA